MKNKMSISGDRQATTETKRFRDERLIKLEQIDHLQNDYLFLLAWGHLLISIQSGR